jgi:putative component of membrane protein insertase Oxa1/YidC/SpoIIIJ protein YidD
VAVADTQQSQACDHLGRFTGGSADSRQGGSNARCPPYCSHGAAAAIGDAGKIGLADARTKAFAWHAIIRKGHDPAAEERREAEEQKRLPTCAVFASEYIERHARPNKRSWAEDERLLRCDVLPVIGDLRIDVAWPVSTSVTIGALKSAPHWTHGRDTSSP